MQKLSSRFLSRDLLRMAVGALLVALCVAGAFHPSTIYAAGNDAIFGLHPITNDPYFIFNTHPGTTLQSSFRITNSGTTTGTATLSAVDATTGQTSGTVFLSTSAKQHKIGTWISLSAQRLTLVPRESRIVTFKVIIPNDARPGQHIGGIVAASEMQKPVNNKNNIQINIQNLSILAVQVNLPGQAIEELTASGIQAGGANGHQNVSIGLNNTGNVLLKPTGSLRLFTNQGQILQVIPIKLDTFLPDTSINYPIYLQKKALGSGTYQATLDLTYGHKQTLHYTTQFTITQQQVAQTFKQNNGPLQNPETNLFSAMPWWQIVLIGLLVLSGVVFLGQNGYRLARTLHRKSKNRE
jgi:hypothetical protein